MKIICACISLLLQNILANFLIVLEESSASRFCMHVWKLPFDKGEEVRVGVD